MTHHRIADTVRFNNASSIHERAVTSADLQSVRLAVYLFASQHVSLAWNVTRAAAVAVASVSSTRAFESQHQTNLL